MTTHVVAFTRDGAWLAKFLAEKLNARAWAFDKFSGDGVEPLNKSIAEWTAEHFQDSDAIIFVSACGIAVRAIAPCLKHKSLDPAVLCLDDKGHNVISLLSGHLGGANDLARKVAALTDGNAVITTATDVNSKVAVDVWAKENNCTIENLRAVKEVSSEILDGKSVGVAVTEMTQPAPWPVTLWLRPKNLVLGVGCKRGTPLEALKPVLYDFLDGAGASPLSISAIASIDIKRDEAGLNALAKELNVPFITYPAEILAKVEGRFTHSEKVLSVTGVDNVCERAAVKAAQPCALIRGKTIYKGITFALARRKTTTEKENSNKGNIQ